MKIACLVFVLTGLGLVGSSRAYASALAPTTNSRHDAEHAARRTPTNVKKSASPLMIHEPTTKLLARVTRAIAPP